MMHVIYVLIAIGTLVYVVYYNNNYMQCKLQYTITCTLYYSISNVYVCLT